MKIKLVEPGWENLTGQFGAYEFVDGVSVDDIPKSEASYLANLVRIETVEDGVEGKNPSSTQLLLDTQAQPAETKDLTTGEEQAAIDEKARAELGAKLAKVYTLEELQAVADAEGIAGLRAIAEPLGLKANSITALIEKVMQFQRDYAPKQ